MLADGMYQTVLNQFREIGLLLDSFEVDTQTIIRCKVEGDTGKKVSGWYRVFSVRSKAGNLYYVGTFGNWKNSAIPEKGISLKYEGKGLSPEDIAAFKQKQKEAQQAADQERKTKQQDVAKRAADIWHKLPKQGHSDYLKSKGVKAYDLGFSRGSIVLPLKRISGELVGLQFIDKDGNKKFLTGTAKAGSFHLIGEFSHDE